MRTLYKQEQLPLWRSAPTQAEHTSTSAARAFREGLHGRFPPRYGRDAWRMRFDERLVDALPFARRVLDVGAGSRPTVPPERRPQGSVYVGLDVDETELRAAPFGSYDELVAADITQPRPELEGRFDLVLSWFVLEHVGSLAAALRTIQSCLRPGGRVIAQFSGARAVFSVLNRMLPEALSSAVVTRAMSRRRESVFPARYDNCHYDALSRHMSTGWSTWQIVPLYVAGLYFRFAPPLLGAYLAYEEVAYRRGWRNLAPYYLVDATR